MSEINAGRVAMVYRGEWSATPTTPYTVMDVVSYLKETYCLYDADGASSLPTTNYWFKLAEHGGNLSISGAVDNHSQLLALTPSANGELYLVKSDTVSSVTTNNVLYCCIDKDYPSLDASWKSITSVQFQGNNFYSGSGTPTSSTLPENITFYVGDTYLDYDNSSIYKCTFGGPRSEATWTSTAVGTLGGLSTNTYIEKILTVAGWTPDSQSSPTYYYQTTDIIDYLSENDAPIIGLKEQVTSQIEAWNYVYKAEVVYVEIEETDTTEEDEGYAIRFYASVKPTVPLTVKCNIYNFNNTEVIERWKNPVAEAHYLTTIDEPTASASFNQDNVKFDFNFPTWKFNADAEASEEPGAEMSYNTETKKIDVTFYIPKSNGEGPRGPSGDITDIIVNTPTKKEYNENPTVGVTLGGSEGARTLTFDFGIPQGEPGLGNYGIEQIKDSTGAVTDNSIEIINPSTTKPYNAPIQIGHTNDINQQATEGFYKFAYDAHGHITSAGSAIALSDLGGIADPSTKSDGQFLKYDDDESKWKAESITATSIGAASTSHASTHVYGGSDVIDPADFGICNRNLLDNAWFTINQRGASNYSYSSTSTYCVDRWRLTEGSAITVNSDNTILLNGSIYQTLENAPSTTNLTATVNATSGTAIVAYENGVFTITSQGGTIKAAKLELGHYSTLDNEAAPNYTDELLKCQRYYYAIGDKSKTNILLASGYLSAATNCIFYINLPVQMRSTPTMSYTSLSNYSVCNRNTVSVLTSGTMTLTQTCGNTIIITTTGAGGSSDSGTNTILNMTGADKLEFSAEI